jgi:hypothetical protein
MSVLRNMTLVGWDESLGILALYCCEYAIAQ